MASKDAIKESIYLHNVLKELNKILKLDILDDKPPMLLLDNQSAIKLGESQTGRVIIGRYARE